MKDKPILWLRNLSCGHTRMTDVAFLCKDYTRPIVGMNCFCRECMDDIKIISVEEAKR